MSKWMKDPFKWAKNKSGFIHVETRKEQNVLELYLKAKKIDEFDVELQPGNETTFIKYFVKDLWQAYMILAHIRVQEFWGH